MKHTCCFCGHSEIETISLPVLKKTISELVEQKGVIQFYSGHKGEFDCLCEKVVLELKEWYPQIRLYWVIPYRTKALEDDFICSKFDDIIFPELRNFRKYAILERNRWMVDHSLYVVSFLHRQSRAKDMLDYAKKKGKRIYNIPM